MAERLNNTIETQINDGNTIVSQIVDNNQPLQTVIQDVPQVQTVLQNGINVSSQINAPFVEVTSVNGKTGDVITEPVVGVFEPNRYYLENTMIAHNNNLYYAKETFTSGSSFNANDWYSVEGSQITVDSALSTTSENPVQNKVITGALNNKANSSDLAEVATSGSYMDLINVPVFPTVNNATLTIQKNGTTVNTFTANSSTNKTANITVPTKTSEIENDSNFLTTEDLFTTKTGTNISISDAAATPLSDFKLKGETSQNGTPTPDAPVAVQTVTGENVVKICGKNLWGAEKHGNLNENTGQEVANNNRWVTDGYIPVKSNTAYTLSSDAENLWYMFCFYDASQNFISGVSYYGHNQTQTTPANCKFVRCVVCDTNTIKTTQRQLEEGSTATAYEPYQGQSYPISLGSIELCKIGGYQDYIYKSGDKWYVHKAVGKAVLDGSEANWATQTSGGLKRYSVNRTDSKSFPSRTSDASLSSHFTPSTTDAVGIFFVAAQTYYFYPDQSIATLDSWKSWLASNNVALYYQLATPTDTEITNEALIAQLEAILSQGYTYAGTNNITTVITAGNEQGELEITYPKIFSKIATTSSLGSIRVGDGLSITPEGTLSTQLGFTTESTSENTKIIRLQDGTTTSYPITTKEAVLGLGDDKFDASFLYDCTLDSTAFTQEQAEALKDAILADKEILIYEVNQSTNKGQYKPYYVSASEDSAFKTINVQYINQAPAQVLFSFMSINGADWTLTVRTTPL